MGCPSQSGRHALQSVKLYSAQYTGQKRCTQRKIPGKKALNSTKYRMKTLDTAQYNGQNGTARHNIPDKNAIHSQMHREERHDTVRNTEQTIFIQLNDLYGTIYRTSTLYSTLNGTKTRYTAQYSGQRGTAQHEIPDMKALYSTVYRTKWHYLIQYTGQALYTAH